LTRLAMTLSPVPGVNYQLPDSRRNH